MFVGHDGPNRAFNLRFPVVGHDDPDNVQRDGITLLDPTEKNRGQNLRFQNADGQDWLAPIDYVVALDLPLCQFINRIRCLTYWIVETENGNRSVTEPNGQHGIGNATPPEINQDMPISNPKRLTPGRLSLIVHHEDFSQFHPIKKRNWLRPDIVRRPGFSNGSDFVRRLPEKEQVVLVIVQPDSPRNGVLNIDQTEHQLGPEQCVQDILGSLAEDLNPGRLIGQSHQGLRDNVAVAMGNLGECVLTQLVLTPHRQADNRRRPAPAD